MPSHPQIIELSAANLHLWPECPKLVSDGKARFDGKGRLRYSHGAPVGKLIFARVRKDGLQYIESPPKSGLIPTALKRRRSYGRKMANKAPVQRPKPFNFDDFPQPPTRD